MQAYIYTVWVHSASAVLTSVYHLMIIQYTTTLLIMEAEKKEETSTYPQEFTEVKKWLEENRLSEYGDSFLKSGFECMADLHINYYKQIIEEVKISIPVHQRRLLSALQVLQSVREHGVEKLSDRDEERSHDIPSTVGKCK